MEGDTLAFAQVMFVIVSSLAGLVGIALGGRVLWRMGSRVQRSAVAPPDDARLQRLEHAVEAIAIEVERISEGQRFTVALLSERLPDRAERGALPAASARPRTNTPHRTTAARTCQPPGARVCP